MSWKNIPYGYCSKEYWFSYTFTQSESSPKFSLGRVGCDGDTPLPPAPCDSSFWSWLMIEVGIDERAWLRVLVPMYPRGPRRFGGADRGRVVVGEGEDPRTRSESDWPPGSTSPLGSGIEKLPSASVRSVARTVDPAEEGPKTEETGFDGWAVVGGRTSIWSWLPGAPLGPTSVPRMFGGSGTGGCETSTMFVRILLRFTSVVLMATPERTTLGIGDDDDSASVVAAAEDVACETAGALVERAFAAVVTLRAVF